MTRISEKVKDLIEVCAYRSLLDFTADPSDTLASYHFTDITSQLMSTWLDSLVELKSRKINAKALAGYRGVGKSHMLAAFGAMLSNPELRSLIQDTHVAASANQLMRRSYPVAFVKRGTKSELDAELRESLTMTLGCSIDDLPEGLPELMQHVSRFSGDVPFVILVDTAFERDTRVSRDDGVFLGEIAEAIQDLNIFVGVALDDDITEADGINAAIAQSYTIDYLDQEHLYKIVDTHIYRKHREAQPLIKEIYGQFREMLPAFNWSEPRFTSLYPLHPSILEIAPFVRLYAPDFALLGFASEAGARIMGRPANSIIALDEVFDKVEDTLRKSPDLQGSFETYDAISKEVVSSIPVMKRLQAKLILKALFILSLDGDGTSANEIAAAMLIYDESNPGGSETMVLELLEKFVSFRPDSLHRREENGEIRFSFRVTGKDDLNSALTAAVDEVTDDVVPVVLNRFAKDRFSEWNISLTDSEENQVWTDCHIAWRGGVRKGRVHWQWGVDDADSDTGVDVFDSEIFICAPGENKLPEDRSPNSFFWIPAELTEDEIETISRYHLLLNDETLKTKYQEQVRAAGHTHAINISKIWDRVFLTDGKLITYDGELSFSATAVDHVSVGSVLSETMTPYFDERYPEHPFFENTLEIKHVSLLVNDLFSGARINNPEVQQLAKHFAQPLGIVELHGTNYLLAKEEYLVSLQYVSHILVLVEAAKDNTVSLSEVYKIFAKPPFGLVREAQQLVMAALVAQRKLEFVTSNGDRIGRRSLDLKIIWDDIAGISKPAELSYPTERLNEWAQIVSGLEKKVSIEDNGDREKIEEGVTAWLESWNEAKTCETFEALPDDILNTAIWQKSVHVERALGTVAESIEAFSGKTLPFEKMIERFADGFSDSIDDYKERLLDLESLRSFIDGVEIRKQAWRYLSMCEVTSEEEVEVARVKVEEQIGKSFEIPSQEANILLEEDWFNFRNLFSEHFASLHDSVMKSHKIQEELLEIKKGDDLWQFERLSELPIFQKVLWNQTRTLLKQLDELDCVFDVRKQLEANPFCSCSFTIAKSVEWEILPDRLTDLISRGLSGYQNTLRLLKADLDQRLEEFSKNSSDPTLVESAVSMLDSLKEEKDIDFSNHTFLGILETVFHDDENAQMISTAVPDKSGIQNADELRAGLNEWVDQLPASPALISIE